jgi:hypothetical protein
MRAWDGPYKSRQEAEKALVKQYAPIGGAFFVVKRINVLLDLPTPEPESASEPEFS